ncbi:MAG: cell division protein ZapA (FtsZ GTPase activity inhibitor) [Rickettsiales bacterium]|jgi:cell division protein ZapA (FtsZ GTPase activity inhibitor)
MTILNLAIGQSKYTVNCEEEDKDKIINLAQKLNERVNNLLLATRSSDEKTVLMLCALALEEDLENSKKNNKKDFKEPEVVLVEKQISQEEIDEAIESQLASHIQSTADYISKLTRRIKES